jgi:hypothetical protein
VKWKVILVTLIIIIIGFAVTAAGSISAKNGMSQSPEEIHVSMYYISNSEYVSQNISFAPNTSIVTYYNTTNFYLLNSSSSFLNNQQNISKISIKAVQQNEGESYYYNLNGTYRAVVFSGHLPDVYYSPLNQTYSGNIGNIITIIGLIIMLIGMVSLVMVIFFPEPEE